MNPRDAEEGTLTKLYGGLMWGVLSNLLVKNPPERFVSASTRQSEQVISFHSGSEFCEVGFRYSYGTIYFCLPLFLESHPSRIPIKILSFS